MALNRRTFLMTAVESGAMAAPAAVAQATGAASGRSARAEETRQEELATSQTPPDLGARVSDLR